jgi:hypothetical protein
MRSKAVTPIRLVVKAACRAMGNHVRTGKNIDW